MAHIGPLNGKSVMDVGCGSGLYVVALKERGARKIVGIDLSANMLESVRRRIGSDTNDVDLIQGEFIALECEPVDFTIAMGYFDYIVDPQFHLEKMIRLSRQAVFASFPRCDWLWPQRWFRYTINGCPIRSYSAKEIRAMAEAAGCTDFEISLLARDYYLEIRRT